MIPDEALDQVADVLISAAERLGRESEEHEKAREVAAPLLGGRDRATT